MDNSQEQITGDNSSIASEGVGDNDAATAPLKYSIVWDDTQLECYYDSAGKKCWKCNWCTLNFAGWSATKALYHVAQVGNCYIQPCKSTFDEKAKSCTRIYSNTIAINAL